MAVDPMKISRTTAKIDQLHRRAQELYRDPEHRPLLVEVAETLRLMFKSENEATRIIAVLAWIQNGEFASCESERLNRVEEDNE